MEKFWLKNYQQGVPAEIDPDQYSSINEIFEKSCKKFNEKIAYTNFDCHLTYNEIWNASQNFAKYCQKKLQLKKGDRIAIMLPNVFQYPIVMYGALLAGLTIVNINPLYTADELTYQLKDSGAKTIVVLENFAYVLEKSLQHVDMQNVIVTKIGDLLSFVKSTLINFVLKYVQHKIPKWKIPNALSLRKILNEGKNFALDEVSVQGNDVAFLQYTGGTTGTAKAAILTHRNIVANILQDHAWVAPVLEEGKEIIITALPMYHVFSLTANCFLFFKMGAQNILITNPRDIPGFIKELAKIRFTVMTGVNTLFNALLHHNRFQKLDFSSLKIVLGGGMAVQKAVAERWKSVTGKPLLEAYGLTETSPGVTINPLNLQEYNGSVGLPIPSTDVCFLDENEQEVPIGRPGELCVKGPQVTQGYWNKPEETIAVFTSDGWLKTGDIATIDAEGFVRIVDRKKDMIDVSGFKVYPNQVEDVIAMHPGVKEVAVIGVKDPRATEVVKAFIVKKDAHLTEKDIRDYCHEHLTGYKVPKYIEFRADLPKSNVGKILRKDLRE